MVSTLNGLVSIPLSEIINAKNSTLFLKNSDLSSSHFILAFYRVSNTVARFLAWVSPSLPKKIISSI